MIFKLEEEGLIFPEFISKRVKIRRNIKLTKNRIDKTYILFISILVFEDRFDTVGQIKGVSFNITFRKMMDTI